MAGSGIRLAAWALLFTAWAVSAVSAWRARRAELPDAQFAEGDLFPKAIGEYLKGNWFEAESLLDAMLRQDPGDVDARLMLATLWRRTGRRAEAQEALKHLQRLEGWGKWSLEIHGELRHLAETAAPAAFPWDQAGEPARAGGDSIAKAA
jgi:predicted Zn-dependent protease